MTGERLLPNLGLTNRWTPASDGWGPGMDANLARLDALLFLTVLSATTVTPPASPAQGDRYVVASGGSSAWAGQDNKVAVWVDAAWQFLTPQVGWTARVLDTSHVVRFNGLTWSADTPYDIQLFRWNMPNSAAEPLLSVIMLRPVIYPMGMTGSFITAKGAASGDAVMTLFKNAGQFASATLPSGALVGSYTSGAGASFQIGDLFEIYGPATPNGTLLGLRMGLAGAR